MRKLSVAQLTFDPESSFQHTVDEVARAGIEAIGVTKGRVHDVGIEKADRCIRDAGLKVAAVHAGGYFLGEGGALAAIEDTKRCIEHSARLEADCLYMVTGPRGQSPWDDALQRFLEGMREVAPMARDYGVRMALEAIHPILPHVSMVHTMGDALEVSANIEGMGVVLDTFHLWWNRHLIEDVHRAGRRIYQVQVSDYEGSIATGRYIRRASVGEGLIPMREILRALDDTGFDGYYDIEVIGPFDADRRKTLVTDCKAALEAIWAEF